MTASPLRRDLLTPEGTPLPFELAGVADRAVAFILDLLMIALGVVALLVLALVLPGEVAGPLVLLGWFLLTQLYFTFFELTWQGRTPGKRWSDLRVMDRHGGRLSASAIFTRNVTRMVEVQGPLVVLFAPEALISDAPGWLGFVLFLWLAFFGVFPLLHRDRLRIGDLIAGTAVVHAPRALLLPDVAEAAARRASRTPDPARQGGPSGYEFTPEQLAIYGVYELQVLEELLRRDRPDRLRALRLVAQRVAKKLALPAGVADDPERFLSAFYAAQRARLERDLLFGREKARKDA